MRPYFAHHPVAGGLFAAALVAWTAIEMRQAGRRRPGATRMDRGSAQVIRACWMAALAVVLVAVRVVPSASIGHGVIGFGIGLVVALAGIALRVWSQKTLGRYFTVTVMTSPDQPVIATGPYRVLRHPSYAGLELVFVGIGLVLGNWVGVAAMALLPMVGFAYRIHVEEAALSAALGEAYRSYAAGRRRMIPFIW